VSTQISTTLARDLRRHQTDAERNLWMRLRARQLDGVKFRRQHSIGAYIVELCSLERRLVIEIDRGRQAESIAAIRQRHGYLNQRGFRVLRFGEREVLTNIDGVLQAILEQLQTTSSET
jgi:very-short-patch-repair endonuclease